MHLVRAHCQLARSGMEGPGGETVQREVKSRSLSCFPESKGDFHVLGTPSLLSLGPDSGQRELSKASPG
jgi:hypothetical protein